MVWESQPGHTTCCLCQQGLNATLKVKAVTIHVCSVTADLYHWPVGAQQKADVYMHSSLQLRQL